MSSYSSKAFVDLRYCINTEGTQFSISPEIRIMGEREIPVKILNYRTDMFELAVQTKIRSSMFAIPAASFGGISLL